MRLFATLSKLKKKGETRLYPSVIGLAALLESPIYGAYSYETTVDFSKHKNTSKWLINGLSGVSHSSGLSISPRSPHRTYSKIFPELGVPFYELKTVLTVGQSGCIYVMYLEATPDALLNGSNSRGSFYSVSLENPVATSSSCTVQAELAKSSKAQSAAVPCSQHLFAKRFRCRWIKPAKAALQSFNDGVTAACHQDMSRLDVGASKIQSLAGDVRANGGSRFVDIRATVPAFQAKVDPGADMTRIPEYHLVVYNMANFWQLQYKYVLGTVLHELVHMAQYDATDSDLQKQLQITDTHTPIRPIFQRS